jgi:hypothetical protein
VTGHEIETAVSQVLEAQRATKHALHAVTQTAIAEQTAITGNSAPQFVM